jgi:hypothetical protein
MPKWSIRDFWGKRTEKKALNPDMRDMLMRLEGVYDPKSPADAERKAEPEQQDEEARRATG